MAKSNTYENDLMQLIYNAVAIANLADNAATAPLTNLQIALHSADPGETGTQSTSEISYTGYARVAVLRSSSGFTVSGNSAVNAAIVAFGQKTAGADVTATHFSVGVAASGATKILHRGALTASLLISNGVTPQFAAGALTVTEE